MIEPIEKNGKLYLPLFIAGKYPQANVDEMFLFSVAVNYDPVNFHEAPIWLGHPEEFNEGGTNEPKALAWIESLMLMGAVLYACIKDETEEFKSLIKNKQFKRWSAELVVFTVDGNEMPYLYAVGLTNRPAVKGLEPFAKFTNDDFKNHKFQNENIKQRFLFEQTNSNNQNNQSIMKDLIVKLMQKFKVSFTDADDEKALVTKLENFISGKDTEVTNLKTKVAQFTDAPGNTSPELQTLKTEVETLKQKNETLQAERVADFVDAAISSGKFLPTQRDSMINMGKTDFENLKTFVGAQAKHPLFTKQVTPGSMDATAFKTDFTDAKFKHPKENRQVTYEDLKNDLTLSGRFTTEEIKALREAEESKA